MATLHLRRQLSQAIPKIPSLVVAGGSAAEWCWFPSAVREGEGY